MFASIPRLPRATLQTTTAQKAMPRENLPPSENATGKVSVSPLVLFIGSCCKCACMVTGRLYAGDVISESGSLYVVARVYYTCIFYVILCM